MLVASASGGPRAAGEEQLAPALARFPLAAAFRQIGPDAVEVRTFGHDGPCPAPVLQHPLMRETHLRVGLDAARGQQPSRHQSIKELARSVIRRCLCQRHCADGQRALSGPVLVVRWDGKLAQQSWQPRLLGLTERCECRNFSFATSYVAIPRLNVP
jgi:hypothetical protein